MASLNQFYELLGIGGKVSGAVGFKGTSLWTIGMTIGYTIFVIILIFVLFYVFLRNMRYNLDVTIYEITGEKKQVIKRFDRGTIERLRDGKEKFRLMRRKKVKLPPPKYEDYSLAVKTKFGLFPKLVKCIDLVHYGSSEYDYLPMAMRVGDSINDIDFDIVPHKNINWAINEIQSDTIKFSKLSDQIQKYVLPISLVFIAIMVIVVAWMITGNLKQLMDVVGSAPG